jgi:hypothetical protein
MRALRDLCCVYIVQLDFCAVLLGGESDAGLVVESMESTWFPMFVFDVLDLGWICGRWRRCEDVVERYPPPTERRKSMQVACRRARTVARVVARASRSLDLEGDTHADAVGGHAEDSDTNVLTSRW